MDPVTFAEARLDEEENAALAAILGFPPDWGKSRPVVPVERWEARYHEVMQGAPWSGRGPRPTSKLVADCGDANVYPAAHIALHDPARALRDVGAGRRILARHRNCGTGYGFCEDGGHGGGEPGEPGCAEIADLIARWADDPDYDQAWKLEEL